MNRIFYSPTEYSGEFCKEKRVLFDLTCTGLDGEKFILQKIFKIAEMSKMTKEERELYH